MLVVDGRLSACVPVTSYLDKDPVVEGLGSALVSVSAAVASLNADGMLLVLEETAGSYDGGCENITDRFVSGFEWMATLSTVGRSKFHRVHRQVCCAQRPHMTRPCRSGCQACVLCAHWLRDRRILPAGALRSARATTSLWDLPDGPMAHKVRCRSWLLEGHDTWHCDSRAVSGVSSLTSLTDTNTPHPDWYTTVLWKQLVGVTVLATNVSGPAPATSAVDVQAWCGRNGGIVIAWTNPSNDTVQLVLDADMLAATWE